MTTSRPDPDPAAPPLVSPEGLGIPDAAYEAGERAATSYVAEVDALDVVSDVLHAAVPLDRAAELRRITDELEALAQEMREEDGRTIRSSGLGEGIRHLRRRADRYDGGGGPGTPAADTEDARGAHADAVDRVRRFVGAYSAAKEGLDGERVATFDDNRLLLSDLRVLIDGAE